VLLRDRGSSEALVGLLISVFAGTSSFVRIFFGRLMEFIGRKAMLVVSVITAAIGVGLIPVMPSTLAVGLILAVFGLSFGLSQPLSMVMVAELAHPNHSGLAMGLRFTSIMLANLVGPILLGFVVAGFGTGSAFYVAAGTVIAVGIQILVRRRGKEIAHG
jgi:MFS family permease